MIVMTDNENNDVYSDCSDCSYQSDIDNEPLSFNFDLSNGSPINPNYFKVVHYNINSILADDKLEQLSDICQLILIDVLIITESKLDSSIPDNLITIPGYHQPIRRDRQINGRYGGGVLVYISENIIFQHRPNLQIDYFEHIWVDVKISGRIFAINALYRPPNESSENHDLFLNNMETLLNSLNNYSASHKIISSDLNFGNIYCKYPKLNSKPLDNKAPDLFSSYGFTQLIDIPTRVTRQTTSLIDLIFVDSINNIVSHGTLPQIADHDGTLSCFSIEKPKFKGKKKIIFYTRQA